MEYWKVALLARDAKLTKVSQRGGLKIVNNLVGSHGRLIDPWKASCGQYEHVELAIRALIDACLIPSHWDLQSFVIRWPSVLAQVR